MDKHFGLRKQGTTTSNPPRTTALKARERRALIHSPYVIYEGCSLTATGHESERDCQAIRPVGGCCVRA